MISDQRGWSCWKRRSASLSLMISSAKKGVREAIARGEAIRPEVEKLRASGDFEGAQAMLSEATRWPEYGGAAKFDPAAGWRRKRT